MSIDGIGKRGGVAPGAPDALAPGAAPGSFELAAPAAQPAAAEGASDAFLALERGDINVQQYLDARVEGAVAPLVSRLSPEQLEFVRAELRAALETDPVLVELVRKTTSGAVGAGMSSPLFRWVVEARGPLLELLRGHGLLAALRDERVFVDGQRAPSSFVEPLELAPGTVVEVFAPRPASFIQVLHEVDDVVAVYKPALLPTEPDQSGKNSVVRQLADVLERDVTELFAVSRLDVGVSGVLLVALGQPAQKRLLQERAGGTLQRRYVALAAGVLAPAEGEWRDALGRGGSGKRVVDERDGQHAHSRYRVVATAAAVSRERPATGLLALSPVTGRTHQLRVHAAAHGAPLLGDRKYSGPARMTLPDGSVQVLPRIMLHAVSVEWGPESERQLVVSEPGTDLVDTWLALGGDPTAIQRALD